MESILGDKKRRLEALLSSYDRLAVALSGGVDSAFLLASARDVIGETMIAVTARSPIHWDGEVADAAKVATILGVTHLIVDSDEMEIPEFLENTPQRCYICKKRLFGKMQSLVKEKGFSVLAHGSNADDITDYRPGLQAARELGVVAPLEKAGLTKTDIRRLARKRGLFVWDKPAMACIATRFPYGSPISDEKIEQVKTAEKILVDRGFMGCRVRHHGDIARIEVPIPQLPKLLSEPMRSRIVHEMKYLGFLYTCVDLEGYVSGSMNRILAQKVR